MLLALGGLQSAQEKLEQIGKGKALSRQQCKLRAMSPQATLGGQVGFSVPGDEGGAEVPSVLPVGWEPV